MVFCIRGSFWFWGYNKSTNLRNSILDTNVGGSHSYGTTAITVFSAEMVPRDKFQALDGKSLNVFATFSFGCYANKKMANSFH
jgi:hypothetical protein